MSLKDVLLMLKGGPGSGNFGHSGRMGKVGGSGPRVNPVMGNILNLVNELNLPLDDLKEWNSLDVDKKMDMFHEDEQKYNRLKDLSDDFKKFQVPYDHPLTEYLGVGQVKSILHRMTDPVLSDKELSKLPTKDNYKAWFWQKHGVVANDLSGENSKRYAEALNDIDKKHGVVGGFFLTGVDTAWQKQGEKGGEFDSPYMTIKVPTRLPKGSQSQDAKDVLSHEYAHYLDAYVLGSPNVSQTRVRGAVVNRKDDTTGWLTTRYAEQLGYSKEPKEGYTQYTAGGKPTSWYRDTSKVNNIGYKDWTPHELVATMFEDHMASRLSSNYYSDTELNWFRSEVLSRL